LKKQSCLYFFILLFAIQQLNAQSMMSNKSWDIFMKKQSMLWDSISTDYYSGIILGNGLLGTNIYKENETAIRFDIGRTDVTDQQPHNDSLWPEALLTQPRLPIGKMLLHTQGKIVGAKMELDIYNALASGSITTTSGTIHFKCVVPTATENIIYIETTVEGNELVSWKFEPEKCISPRITTTNNAEVRNNLAGSISSHPNVQLLDTAGFSICYQALAVQGEFSTLWKQQQVKEKTVLQITVTYSRDRKGVTNKQAVADMRSFTSRSIDSVIKEHKNWWHNFYQQSFVSIPDGRLEGFYWQQLYKLASATRPDKPMIDLMGPWFTSRTPWPAIWWNLNTQLTYSPIFTSNHIELGKSFFSTLINNQENLKNNVPVEWRHDAAAIGRISSYDLYSPLRASDLRNGRFEPGNLTWTLFYYYQYYLYTKDTIELKNNIYPLLKRSVNYLMHLLYKDDHGIYHLPMSQSPEYANVEDAHYSLAALKWGLKTLMEVNIALRLNDADNQKWMEVNEHLVPFYTNETGYMIGKDVSLTTSHRHYSHLMQIYPFCLVSFDDPKTKTLVKKSIQHWMGLDKALSGYSFMGASSMSSLMGDGNSSYAYINKFLDKHGTAGGLYKESGPCFETPPAIANSLLEMLLQSWNGVIKVFHAIPDSWKNIVFADLRAEGAFLVSASRKNGMTEYVKIKSLAGGSTEVLTDIPENQLQIIGGTNTKYSVTTVNDRSIIRIQLEKGQEILLRSTLQPQKSKIESVPYTFYHQNFWGLKKSADRK